MSYCVYVIESDVGLTKIGITSDIKRRLRDLQGSSPVPVRLFKAMEVLGEHIAHLIELQCHEELKAQGLWSHCEWFRVDAQTAWDKVSSVAKDWFSSGRNSSDIIQAGYFKRRAAALKEIRGENKDKIIDPFVEKLKSMPCNTRISAMRKK